MPQIPMDTQASEVGTTVGKHLPTPAFHGSGASGTRWLAFTIGDLLKVEVEARHPDRHSPLTESGQRLATTL